MAEELSIIADRLDSFKGDKDSEIKNIIREIIHDHKRILYNGNNYSEEWRKEAKRRGLADLHTTVDAIEALKRKENIELLQKIENISQKTIREKLLTYFSNEARRNKSNIFEIPFNRQDLADYLNIDRSAMSFELSKMQKDGLIKFEKNKFMLKNI